MSKVYRSYVLTMLTLVYTLNLVDRGLIMLLLQPIKEDLHLSDTELGFLTGLAFGLFYATLGLPIARWADRGNRVTIASLAIGLWGLTVMACQFVVTYPQLVLARIAAAVGEAGGKPPTYSLVGDYYPRPVERTGAMAVYWLGGSLSPLLSYIVGGWLNALVGWRQTFFWMGIPGLVLALLVKLTIKEPRALTSDHSRVRAVPSWRQVLHVLWARRSCRHLTIALILVYTMGFGLNPWYAAFMIRSHGMGTQDLGLWLGLIFGLSGMAGVLMGGYVARRWFPHDERGQLRTAAVAVASVVPWFVAFLMLPDKYQALIALIPLMVVLNFFFAPTYALLQRLVSDDMRATALAVVLLLTNLIGMGFGPQLVGVLSDLLRPDLGADSLRFAMLSLSFIAIWAAYHFWKIGRTVEDDLRAASGTPAQNQPVIARRLGRAHP